MKEEEPKRKAAEAAAKERAMEDEKASKDGAEALARAKEDALAAQKDLIAEAAKARAEIDRARRGGSAPPMVVTEAPSVPVAEVVAKPDAKPDAKPKTTTAPVGAVAAMIEGEKSTVWNEKIAIGLGIAAAIVVLLFFLPSSKSKVRVVTGAQGRRR